MTTRKVLCLLHLPWSLSLVLNSFDNMLAVSTIAPHNHTKTIVIHS